MAIMEPNRLYDFSVYVPSVLGTAYRRVTNLGYISYTTAIALRGEILPIHAELISTGQLPEGTPKNPKHLNYYHIQKADGSTTVLAEAWIVQDSITEIQAGRAIITIPDATTSDLVRVRDMFKQAGIVNFDISFD